MSEQEIQNILQRNTALRNENAVLKEELTIVQEQLAWLKKQMFGRKTEQSSVILDGSTQLSIFPDETVQESVMEQEETVIVPEHKQRKKKRTHDEWMSSLPVEEIVHEEEHPTCEKCGSEMKEIGEEKAYDELIYTPAKMHVRRHIVKKYKCPECGEKSEHDVNHEDDIEH